MSNTELVCPKCSYKNQAHRSTCKNCGETLSPEKAVISKNRKKPLKQWRDWIRAFVGLVFLVPGVFTGVMAINFALNLSLISLLFLVLSAGLLYAGWLFFLVPVYASFIFQRGSAVTTGEVLREFEEEYTNTEGASYTTRFVVVRFVPEKSHDVRPRQLKCEVTGTRMYSGENIRVYYALENPDAILLQGEVKEAYF